MRYDNIYIYIGKKCLAKPPMKLELLYSAEKGFVITYPCPNFDIFFPWLTGNLFKSGLLTFHIVFVCLHITLPHNHHYADLSESIELLKCVSGTSCLQCVSKIKSILSIIFNAIYGAVCIQLTHFSYDDCENMSTLSYHFKQIGSMTHLPLFRIWSCNNGMRCMSFLYYFEWLLILR